MLPTHKQAMKFSNRGFSTTLLFAVTLGLGFLPGPSAEAQTYTVLYSFAGGNDGANPLAGVTIDSSGNLYGATLEAGVHGFGTVYQLAPNGSNWTFSTIYGFRGSDQSDGAEPESRPVFGPNDALYGTTNLGGFGQGCIAWYNGCGTVYSLVNNAGTWNESVLFQFGTSNGGYPAYGDVVFNQSGNLYGTSPNSGTYYSGVAYEFIRDADWAESLLLNFQAMPDGSAPLNGPIIDSAGNLYGTTSAGGANGYGTVYELSPSANGLTETTLYNFTNESDGGSPTSNLVMDRAGNLYGATQTGGAYAGGTVFRLRRNPAGTWTLSSIYEFRTPTLAGSNRTLTIDSMGNLYGTTSADIVNPWGSVFKVQPVSATNWAYTTLHNFTGTTDGGTPWGRLVLDSGGNLYGTAELGGTNNCGVVFKIAP
jgi:uncharacterized repeat protein (TIGR03803 family)